MLSIFLGVCDSNLKSVAFFVTQAIDSRDGINARSIR